ncbi:hypothetical protein JW905_06450, partial [bacterium]|nr:hypothetical protein [candidate division CSSED10-310 bacterium]
FTGTIETDASPHQPGNGHIEMLEADIVLGTYTDVDDGFGGINVPVTDAAAADYTSPHISCLNVAFLDDHSAVIQWMTDEPARGTVVYDTVFPPAAHEASSPVLTTGHSITLTDLEQCLDYYFFARATDDAGNQDEEDLGADYLMTTMVRVYSLQENLDTDLGWDCEGDWEWGVPTGQPSGPGHDPSAGFDGPNVYGTNLSGAYQGGSAYHLTTPAIDCSASFDTRLTFKRWLAVDEHGMDEACVAISTDGVSWDQLFQNPNSNFYEYRWADVRYDIGQYADGEPEVYIRWTMGPAGTGSAGGWNIDNIEVSHAAPCNVPILIHHGHSIDDSQGNDDGLINPLEDIAMPVTLRNVGLDAANVEATISSTYPHVSITTPQAQFGAIPQGGTGQSLTAFDFTVLSGAVDGDSLPFILNWTCDETSGVAGFAEQVVAANLVYEAFMVVDDTLRGDGDGILDPGETAALVVMVKNEGRLVAANISGLLSVDHPEYVTIDDGEALYPDMVPQQAAGCLEPYFTVSCAVTTPDHTMVQFAVQLTADGHEKTVTFDAEITTSTFARRYTWNMHNDPGWTMTGQWAWGVPTGLAGDPSGGCTGASVYGYNLNGAYTNNMSETPLTTGPINCANFTSTEVRFKRWLGIESSSYDHASFQVSSDGTAWSTIWSHNGESFTDPDWQAMSYDISAYADGEPTVYLRWVMGTTDLSVTFCGWNIDDVEIWAEVGDPQPILSHFSHEIDDSEGNNDGYINPGETIAMAITAENFGTAGSDISAYLSTNQPAITMIDDFAYFEDIPAAGTGHTMTPFRFSLSETAPDSGVTFTVTWFSTQGNGSFQFSDDINAADLVLGASFILDQDGDGDGILDPGETAQLAVSLINSGRADALGLIGTLSSDSPEYLTIVDGEAEMEDVYQGGTGGTIAPHFTIQVNPAAPDHTMVTFTLGVTGDNCAAEVEIQAEITWSTFARRYWWDMDHDPGWQFEGQWAWGIPEGLDDDPAAGFTGSRVVGYNLAGAYANDIPEYSATTDALDCSALEDVELRFMRWLGVESATWDHAAVRISTDGVNWTEVWEHTGTAINDLTWQEQIFDISAQADGEPTVYLRWVMGETDSSMTYCGWNLDDVEMWASAGLPRPTGTPSLTPPPTQIPTRTPTLVPTVAPSETPPATIPPTPPPTVTPVSLPTTTPSPPPTGTPPPGAGMHLVLNDTDLVTGDDFHLHFDLVNSTPVEMECDVYLLLGFAGMYWCWPSWCTLDENLDYLQMDMPGMHLHHEDVLWFEWPAGAGQTDLCEFFGAAFHRGGYDLIGDLQHIQWAFH